eukprot:m.245794 g.245794  ORF g.245794 m.245794 type:complete len:484 (-) comp16109_c3_seq20:45-1496(-)
MVRSRTSKFEVEAPWEVVVHAYDGKMYRIPDPEFPEILRIEFENYQWRPENNLTTLVRLPHLKIPVPSFVLKAFTKETTLDCHSDQTIDRANKRLVTITSNLNLTNVVKFVETSVITPHPDDPNLRTLMNVETSFNIQTSGWGIGKLEGIAVKAYMNGISKARKKEWGLIQRLIKDLKAKGKYKLPLTDLLTQSELAAREKYERRQSQSKLNRSKSPELTQQARGKVRAKSPELQKQVQAKNIRTKSPETTQPALERSTPSPSTLISHRASQDTIQAPDSPIMRTPTSMTPTPTISVPQEEFVTPDSKNRKHQRVPSLNLDDTEFAANHESSDDEYDSAEEFPPTPGTASIYVDAVSHAYSWQNSDLTDFERQLALQARRLELESSTDLDPETEEEYSEVESQLRRLTSETLFLDPWDDEKVSRLSALEARLDPTLAEDLSVPITSVTTTYGTPSKSPRQRPNHSSTPGSRLSSARKVKLITL